MTQRKLYDAYQTPNDVISKLFNQLYLEKIERFLEPCMGVGNIYNRVHAKQKLFCEIAYGHNKDYLDTHYRKPIDVIITNPPFTLWRQFLEKSLKEAPDGLVCYLLRLNCLGSGVKTKRARFWNDNPPDFLFPLEQRPSFTNGGTDMTDYAWYVWERNYPYPRVKRDPMEWLEVL